VLKTETNAWRVVEHRTLEINSEELKGEAVTMNSVISRYTRKKLPELRHSTADAYRSYPTNHIAPVHPKNLRGLILAGRSGW